MGSDEGHSNESLSERDKVTRQCSVTNHNLSEDEGEPKQNRAEAILLSSLTARLNRLTGLLFISLQFGY